jgi:hypothetical protein
MPDVKAEMLECGEEDEHILRRLGGAVVVQWARLPDAMRDLLVEQATLMWDRYDTVQLRQQIELFIRKHQSREE